MPKFVAYFLEKGVFAKREILHATTYINFRFAGVDKKNTREIISQKISGQSSVMYYNHKYSSLSNLNEWPVRILNPQVFIVTEDDEVIYTELSEQETNSIIKKLQ